MNTSNFIVGPVKEGLRKDQRPFAIPEDAFVSLLNAYQFRGRVVRREGYTLLGRLANNTPVMGLKTRELFGIGLQQLIAFDTTESYFYNTGPLTFDPLLSVMPVVWSGTDYQFFFTTNYAGAFWATNSKPGLNGVAISGITNSPPPNAEVTTSTPHGFTTGQTVVFVNVGGMIQINGLSSVITVTSPTKFKLNTIDTSTFGVYTSGGIALNSEVAITGQDGIRYYGVLTNGTGWANYNPPLNTTTALAGALLIFPYRGYLVFLNTSEGNETGTQNFGQRARWIQIGTPYYSLPVPTTPDTQTVDIKAARDDLFGRGGANDAPTQEVIVGAEFIRDILVVYFERSTWRLRFVNNSQNPFVWERVNVELGSDCTFSVIPFDKGLMAIGNRGIVISDGNDTSRFDEKIPDDIFTIRQANNGLERVYGIRTFKSKLNFWTIPSATNIDGIYPDLVLVFNYDTKNWAYFDDCFTCFGYFYPSALGYTWNALDQPWPTYDTENASSGVTQLGLETIIAGNQQGFVLKLEQGNSINSPSLYISAIATGTITSPNYNLPDETWVTLSGITGTTGDDGVDLNGRNFKISQVFNPNYDPNNFTINEFASIDGGAAVGALYVFQIDYVPILPGSVQINVGTLVFQDTDLDGNLFSSGGNGTIDYNTGTIVLNFVPPILSTEVYIRVVSLNPEQEIVPVNTTGAYGGGGLIAKISNIDIQTKIFNFFNDDKRARLSKIDFYTDTTANGQFTCNVFADSSNVPVNTPLLDNPQSNVVLTSPTQNQVGTGDESIYRLYCDVLAQTVQLQLTMSDAQLATNSIQSEDIEILAMMFTLRRGGRLP